MWDYFYIFMCAGDMVVHGASDRAVKLVEINCLTLTLVDDLKINSNKRRIGWVKERILNQRLDIIFNPSHFLGLIYILDDMILKMKRFVI